jgi:hypothetical protein
MAVGEIGGTRHLSSLLLVTLLASCHSPAPRVTTVRRAVASLARSPGVLIHAEVVQLLSLSRTPTARHQQELSRLYAAPDHITVRFVTRSGLTGAGQELLAALNQIQDHGLDLSFLPSFPRCRNRSLWR